MRGLWLTRILGAIGLPLFVLSLMASVAMTLFILTNPESLKARLNLAPFYLGISLAGMVDS